MVVLSPDITLRSGSGRSESKTKKGKSVPTTETGVILKTGNLVSELSSQGNKKENVEDTKADARLDGELSTFLKSYLRALAKAYNPNTYGTRPANSSAFKHHEYLLGLLTTNNEPDENKIKAYIENEKGRETTISLMEEIMTTQQLLAATFANQPYTPDDPNHPGKNVLYTGFDQKALNKLIMNVIAPQTTPARVTAAAISVTAGLLTTAATFNPALGAYVAGATGGSLMLASAARDQLKGGVRIRRESVPALFDAIQMDPVMCELMKSLYNVDPNDFDLINDQLVPRANVNSRVNVEKIKDDLMGNAVTRLRYFQSLHFDPRDVQASPLQALMEGGNDLNFGRQPILTDAQKELIDLYNGVKGGSVTLQDYARALYESQVKLIENQIGRQVSTNEEKKKEQYVANMVATFDRMIRDRKPPEGGAATGGALYEKKIKEIQDQIDALAKERQTLVEQQDATGEYRNQRVSARSELEAQDLDRQIANLDQTIDKLNAAKDRLEKEDQSLAEFESLRKDNVHALRAERLQQTIASQDSDINALNLRKQKLDTEQGKVTEYINASSGGNAARTAFESEFGSYAQQGETIDSLLVDFEKELKGIDTKIKTNRTKWDKELVTRLDPTGRPAFANRREEGEWEASVRQSVNTVYATKETTLKQRSIELAGSIARLKELRKQRDSVDVNLDLKRDIALTEADENLATLAAAYGAITGFGVSDFDLRTKPVDKIMPLINGGGGWPAAENNNPNRIRALLRAKAEALSRTEESRNDKRPELADFTGLTGWGITEQELRTLDIPALQGVIHQLFIDSGGGAGWEAADDAANEPILRAAMKEAKNRLLLRHRFSVDVELENLTPRLTALTAEKDRNKALMDGEVAQIQGDRTAAINAIRQKEQQIIDEANEDIGVMEISFNNLAGIGIAAHELRQRSITEIMTRVNGLHPAAIGGVVVTWPDGENFLDNRRITVYQAIAEAKARTEEDNNPDSLDRRADFTTLTGWGITEDQLRNLDLVQLQDQMHALFIATGGAAGWEVVDDAANEPILKSAKDEARNRLLVRHKYTVTTELKDVAPRLTKANEDKQKAEQKLATLTANLGDRAAILRELNAREDAVLVTANEDLNTLATDRNNLVAIGITEPQLLNFKIDQLMPIINAAHPVVVGGVVVSWPADENNDPARIQTVVNAIAEQKARAEELNDGGRPGRLADFATITGWAVSEQELRNLDIPTLHGRMHALNAINPLEGWPAALDAANEPRLVNAKTEARSRMLLRHGHRVDTQIAVIDQRTTQLTESKQDVADLFTDQIKQLEVARNIVRRKDQIYASISDFHGDKLEQPSFANDVPQDPEYSAVEKELIGGLPPPKGLSDMYNLLLDYQSNQEQSREEQYRKIQEVLPPQRLADLLAVHVLRIPGYVPGMFDIWDVTQTMQERAADLIPPYLGSADFRMRMKKVVESVAYEAINLPNI